MPASCSRLRREIQYDWARTGRWQLPPNGRALLQALFDEILNLYQGSGNHEQRRWLRSLLGRNGLFWFTVKDRSYIRAGTNFIVPMVGFGDRATLLHQSTVIFVSLLRSTRKSVSEGRTSCDRSFLCLLILTSSSYAPATPWSHFTLMTIVGFSISNPVSTTSVWEEWQALKCGFPQISSFLLPRPDWVGRLSLALLAFVDVFLPNIEGAIADFP